MWLMGFMKKKNNLSWLSSQASDKLHAVQPKFNVAILAQCMAIWNVQTAQFGIQILQVPKSPDEKPGCLAFALSKIHTGLEFT